MIKKNEKPQEQSNNNIFTRREWLFRIVLLLAPLVFWMSVEILLSIITNHEEPFRRVSSNNTEAFLINQSYFNQFFSYRLPEMNNLPVTNNWMPVQEENSLKIFCLGGSTTLGYPYNQFRDYGCPVSFPRFLESMLNDMNLTSKVRVMNLGCNALSSREIGRVLADVLEFNPDIFIIYSGHNEFFGPNEFAISKSKQFILTHRWVADFYDLLRRTWLYQGINKLLRNAFGMGKRASMDFKGWGEKNFIAYNQNLENRLQKNFQRNLKKIINIAKGAEVPVYVCTLVSNMVFPPFMSAHDEDFDMKENEKWNFFYDQGKEYFKQNEWEKAISFFDKAAKIDPCFADLYFQEGKAFRRISKSDSAVAAFRKASDLDALPFRARSWINPTIRKVADEMEIEVIDLEQAFIDLSGESIPDPDLLLEHVHPNVTGYYKIAQLISERLLTNFFRKSTHPEFRSLEFYLEQYGIQQLSIDKIEYDLSMIGNYLERLSMFNPEVREFVFDVSRRAYDDAVRIRDAYMTRQNE